MKKAVWFSRHQPTAEQIADASEMGFEIAGSEPLASAAMILDRIEIQRNWLKAQVASTRPHTAKGSMNIIDSVVLTPAAVAAWSETAKTGLTKLREAGVTLRPDQIGTEEAYEQPDGSLIIQCRAGEYIVHLRLEPKEWSHAN